MGKIKKEKILKAVKKAFKEGRQWAELDWGYAYALMLDTSDASVWADTFINCNDCKVYHSETIVMLTEYSRTIKESEGSLAKEAVAFLSAAGWEVEE